jgi:hypothetical protein
VGTLRVEIPDHLLQQAKKLRAEGLAWHAVARRIGFHQDTVRIRLDPEFRVTTARRKFAYSREEYDRNMRRAPASYMRYVSPPLTEAELKARRALIPPDTRDNTGRLLGDPIPGDLRRRA